MGTRGLTMVVLDGEMKVAQYGQWDHYPSGVGCTVLKFCRAIAADPDKWSRFTSAVAACRWITEEEARAATVAAGIPPGSEWMNMQQANRFKAMYPHLDRDMGGGILECLLTKGSQVLKDSRDFAADSLFCEWAYVVDLDKHQLEVYKGFNKNPLPAGQRFSDMKPDSSSAYYPITHVATFSFADLPTASAFMAQCDPPEEDEGE